MYSTIESILNEDMNILVRQIRLENIMEAMLLRDSLESQYKQQGIQEAEIYQFHKESTAVISESFELLSESLLKDAKDTLEKVVKWFITKITTFWRKVCEVFSRNIADIKERIRKMNKGKSKTDENPFDVDVEWFVDFSYFEKVLADFQKIPNFHPDRSIAQDPEKAKELFSSFCDGKSLDDITAKKKVKAKDTTAINSEDNLNKLLDLCNDHIQKCNKHIDRMSKATNSDYYKGIKDDESDKSRQILKQCFLIYAEGWRKVSNMAVAYYNAVKQAATEVISKTLKHAGNIEYEDS